MKTRSSTGGQLAASCAVLLALGALAAFSLWGMTPTSSTTGSSNATPTSTATAAPAGESDDGGD